MRRWFHFLLPTPGSSAWVPAPTELAAREILKRTLYKDAPTGRSACPCIGTVEATREEIVGGER